MSTTHHSASLCLAAILIMASGFVPCRAQLTQRVENTSISLPAEPGPAEQFDYQTEDAFPGLTFTNPVAIFSPPGETNRLFIIERQGFVRVITNLVNPAIDTFLDIDAAVIGGGTGSDERGLLGMAFHPNYQVNRYVYVFYTGRKPGAGDTFHDVLARYEISPDNMNTALADSAQILFAQYDEAGNHNGGDVHFGPDGYLYVSLGDEGGGNDSWNNSQQINSDFFSAIARLDVDMLPGSLGPNPHPANDGPVTNYAIPPDNPYIGATNFNGSTINSNEVRTEFYAVGLRNPWRMSFDEVTGRLYVGDVGQSAREEIDLIVKGGNYGWAFREGTIAGPKAAQAPVGWTGIDPILDYTRGSGTSQGFVVTGGVVYRGNRLPGLVGRYIFADYGSGNIWSLYYDGAQATEWTRLTSEHGVAAFGKDPRNGDLLLADLPEHKIKRLIINTNTSVNALPATLDETGVFSDLGELAPHPGVVPYDVNVPLWSDYATKRRWFSVPDTNQTMDFSREGNWGFPSGTVWVKHFDLQMTNGVPSSARRLETRVMVKTTGTVYGATYRWGSDTTNAYLVPGGGLDEALLVVDAGVVRTQVWRYPSRSECLDCHTPGAGYALGFNTVQLNRDLTYGVVTQGQVRTYSDIGYFSTNVNGFNTLPALAPATDGAYSLEYRARSYLQANCAPCHFPGVAFWDARIQTSLSAAGLVDGVLNDDLGHPDNRVVRRGMPGDSVLLTRMASLGGIRMPPLATSLLDTQGIALVTAWIQQLAGYETFSEWQQRHFGSTNAVEAARSADPDADGAVNGLEYLTRTDPTNQVGDGWGVDMLAVSNGASMVKFNRIANRGFELQCSTNLLEPNAWSPVDVPGNQPFISASDSMAVVSDPATNTAGHFYRMRVYEP